MDVKDSVSLLAAGTSAIRQASVVKFWNVDGQAFRRGRPNDSLPAN